MFALIFTEMKPFLCFFRERAQAGWGERRCRGRGRENPSRLRTKRGTQSLTQDSISPP